MSATAQMPAVLTIAGSDSGGGAGVQADLKAIGALGCFGTSAITCITAQNPDGVRGVEAVSTALVRQQIEAVIDAFPLGAVKTGMLLSAELIEVVVDVLNGEHALPLVVDPVMVATSGARLLQENAVATLTQLLLPIASVITPNVPEAEALLDAHISNESELMAAAASLAERFGCACALKGGHLASSSEVVDVLVEHNGKRHRFAGRRIEARETHGTGCTFASACAAHLARGLSLADAVAGAKEYVAAALQNARPVGNHWPLGRPE